MTLNAFLPSHLARHNERFAVPAVDPAPAWRAWPEGLSAEAVFAFWYRRTVARDDTIAWSGGALALPRRSDGRTRAGREITVAERLDGSLWAELEGTWQPLVSVPPSVGQLRARHTGARWPHAHHTGRRRPRRRPAVAEDQDRAMATRSRSSVASPAHAPMTKSLAGDSLASQSG